MIPLYDAGDRSLQAEIAFIAYTLPDAEPRARPVTFVFNGGPGAASAYLQIGALGPWRLPFDQVSPSTPPVLVANSETWLDFTDLVFIDPPGTGYSRIDGGDNARKQFWSVDGDIDALAVFVRKWIERAGRQVSPKFVVGESYGGFRAPKVARALLDGQGVGISGVIMVSPVIDFGMRGQPRHVPWPWITHLPSMSLAARAANGAFDRGTLRDVEEYAAGDYLRDLLRGERDSAAIERMSTRVAAFTGLDPALVRKLAGKVDTGTFEREIYRSRAQVASSYDTTVTGYDPNPSSARSSYDDPMLTALTAPLTSAMTDLYQHVLDWRVEDPYRLLNTDASNRWDFGRSRFSQQVVDDLRNLLALDPRVRVMVTHGANDMVTPYFESELILDQLPAYGSADRLVLKVYGGGHMYYSRDASRRALRADAEALYRAVLDSSPRE